jgi:hypothetical protein
MANKTKVIFAVCTAVMLVGLAAWKWSATDATPTALSKQRFINGLEFTVQQLPVELLVERELRSESSPANDAMRDSIRASYGDGMYFMFKIGTDDRKGINNDDPLILLAMRNGDFEASIKQMAFEMPSTLELQVGDSTYEPTLCHFERTYELSRELRFFVAFAPLATREQQEFTFTWNDQYFNTGINRFKFKPQS